MTQPILEIQNLHIQIANKSICQDVHLQIQSGDFWGVLGGNGSGKTTFLHTLAGLRAQRSGYVLLENKLLPSLPQKVIGQKLGILLQDTNFLFPQKVYEYCLAGRHPHLSYFSWENADDHRITQESLAIMEIDSLSEQLVFTLSGGERRRLAMATLLTQDPLLYLLDEPTNHLDLRHQIKALNHFKMLTEGRSKAVMMSLHDLNLVSRYCNKILMLFDDGSVLQGDSTEVLTASNLSRLYRHSIEGVWVGDRTVWISSHV